MPDGLLQAQPWQTFLRARGQCRFPIGRRGRRLPPGLLTRRVGSGYFCYGFAGAVRFGPGGADPSQMGWNRLVSASFLRA